MNKFKNNPDLFSKIAEKIPYKVKRYRRLSMLIAAMISDNLKRENKSQKWLADNLQRKESQISKWLNGDQNFTLRTLVEIEEALGVEIVTINYNRDKKHDAFQLPDNVIPLSKIKDIKNLSTISQLNNSSLVLSAECLPDNFQDCVMEG